MYQKNELKRMFRMNFFVNKNIRDTKRIYPMQERSKYLRYDMNENPEGLPKDFIEMVKKEITPEFLATYPEQGRFLRKYANYTKMPIENIMATNGSDMAIRYIFETFGESGKDVVTVSPSFEMYRVHCNILGYNCVQIEYNDNLTLNVDKIVAAINERTRIVVLVNPNNPIGNTYNKSEIEAIVQRANERGVIVVIDEAYYYFYNETSLDLINKYNNVILLRTFSKLFSLAACRLGVIITSSIIINNVKKSALSFDVNSLALLFAERLLEHPEIEKELIQNEKDGKRYLLKELSRQGYEHRECKGNFVFIKPRKNAYVLAEELKQKHLVLVKTFSQELLSSYIRVTTGSVGSMQKFLKNFFEADIDG